MKEDSEPTKEKVDEPEVERKIITCPECGCEVFATGRCLTCPVCGWSACSL